jgi:PAS domain S-box-containing protein
MPGTTENRWTASHVAASQAEDATLAAIVRSAPDAVISKTVDGIVTSWNAAAERLYGYRAEQMIGRPIERTFPADKMQEESDRHARVAAGVPESGFRCTRVHADGHLVDVVMSMTPVYDGFGRLVTIASISRPVTDAERAQDRFASLLEAAPDAIVCVGGDGRIVTVNAQTTRLFGYTRDELLGAEMEMLLPETLTEVHRSHRADFLLHPQLRTMGQGLSLSARRRDGSVFPVEVSLAPDTSGTDFTVIAAVRDVTAQREIEARAVENESRLRQVTESVETVFVLIELNTSRYLYLSSGFEKLFGSEPRDLMASQSLMDDLIHPEDRDIWLSNRAAITRGEAVQAQYRIQRRDGQQSWLRVTSTPVENPQGPVTRTVITIEDVTSHVEASEALRNAEAVARKAEAEARNANEAKNQFLSRMSHELRTPLNAVLGFGQLLQRRLADTDNADAIRHILKGGRHLLDLINDVLDIARIESGEMSLSTESVALEELVAETIDLLRPLATDAGVMLHAEGGPAEDHVLADRQRLRQILLNLLSNAIKYNHTDGDVWVGWQASDGYVAVTVRDNGQGIAPEYQARLFTPFDRLGAEASGVEGTGIGLALTRALAEMMGGSITVESAPGQGSTFTVTLVAAPAADTRLATPGDLEIGVSEDASDDPAATLLYIEDNAPNVRVVEELLKLRPEWRLVHAATGSLGIDLALSQPPDLILLDLHLPDLSGRDVLIELKRRPELRDVKVIILTADAHAGLSRQLILAGAAGYLTKPFDIDDVLAHLDEAVEAKGLKR